MKELLTKEQIHFLKSVTFGNTRWSVNPLTGLIDVDGYVMIEWNYLKDTGILPVEFGKVTGYFNATQTEMVHLKGLPMWVDGNLKVRDNPIESFDDWEPIHVGGDFVISFTRTSRESLVRMVPNIQRLIGMGAIVELPEMYQDCADEYYMSFIPEFI